MNYYAEWWEKARNSSGILTKPVIRKKLEDQVKDLQNQVQVLTDQLNKKTDKKGHYKQELNLILNNWTFDNKNPQSAQEFLTKFGDWIKNTQQKAKELEKKNQSLIDDLQRDLGINFLLDYQEIVEKLKGRTVEQLLNEYEKEVQKAKNLEKYLVRPREEKETQTKLTKKDIEQLQNTVDYYSQNFPNLEKELAELREKEKDKDQEIRALKLDKGDLLKVVGEKESELLEAESNNQGRLRQINLLFDPVAKDYETIDFAGLYTLLQQIAERERERERETKVNDDDQNNSPLSPKQRRKLKKRTK